MGPEAFDFQLPADHIAQAPAPRRADGRLLVGWGEPVHARVGQLREHLPAEALVVVNASKVVPARASATRQGDDRRFEVLVCDPGPGQGPGAQVRAWVRGARRLREGDVLALGELRLAVRGVDAIDGRARVLEVLAGEVLPALHAHGEVPLPPYVRRPSGPSPEDRARYQTVYAGPEGSVAAPTAGLHLEPELLAALDVAALTLHVGPGTFLPMDVADIRDHRVGAERIELSEQTAARIVAAQRQGRPIVAVGTTVVRALEAIAARGPLRPYAGTIDLVVTPGFSFRVVTHLLTNFHLPRSSLLMLVCAFAGHRRVLDLYATAVAEGYRFYSYGDCMLVDRQASP